MSDNNAEDNTNPDYEEIVGQVQWQHHTDAEGLFARHRKIEVGTLVYANA